MVDDPTVTFTFPSPEHMSPPCIQLVDVAFGYANNPSLFSNVNFAVDMSSRICLCGPNGIGKSTLLNVIKAQLEPRFGIVTINPRLKLGSFAQHHVEQYGLIGHTRNALH